ncbi:MAG: flagellar filament capping protein FliD [Bacteroidota bacterium]
MLSGSSNPALQLFRSNSLFEQLIQATLISEQQPLGDLENQRSQLEASKRTIGDFDSTLSSLRTLLDRFADPLADPFSARSAQTASEAFTASAEEGAFTGSYSLQIDQLATTDRRISQQLSQDGTSLRSFFDANGAQTFQVEVATPTDEDANARTALDVTVDPTGATDREILTEIARAINDAVGTAATEGTVPRSAQPNASILNETSDTARLSVRSGSTGFSNRLSFNDSAGGLLSLLQLNTDAVAEGTGGGQVNAVGTNETDSALNSRVVLDGLTIYRDSNQLSDVLDGVTLSLNQTTTGAEAFSVGVDEDALRGEVETFIEQYNNTLNFISQNAQINVDTGFRGPFANDSAVTGLRANLRTELVQPVASLGGSPIQSITDLGIEIQDNGTLRIDDAEALTNALASNPDAVRSLFAAEDGLANRFTAQIDRFVGIDSILNTRTDILDDRIGRVDRQIDSFNERLARREESLRAEFAQLEETITSLQNQQSFLFSLF